MSAKVKAFEWLARSLSWRGPLFHCSGEKALLHWWCPLWGWIVFSDFMSLVCFCRTNNFFYLFPSLMLEVSFSKLPIFPWSNALHWLPFLFLCPLSLQEPLFWTSTALGPILSFVLCAFTFRERLNSMDDFIWFWPVWGLCHPQPFSVPSSSRFLCELCYWLCSFAISLLHLL